MTTILIVDDERDSRRALALWLTSEGYYVIEATDGPTGLTLAAAQHPDLVITDILMPRMNGYEFVRRLVAISDEGHIPIIFYTCLFSEQEVHSFKLAAGRSFIIAKPARGQVIVETVREALSTRYMAR